MTFLESAADLFGESGYEAVTMTAVAERAGASIGALYDYFPDKHALALALLAQYTEEMDAHWKALLASPAKLTKSALADLFVDAMLDFVQERPAYLPLLSAPISYTRSASARQPLRKTIAAALQTMNRSLTADRAFLSAQVIVQLVKGLLSVYKQAAPKDRELVAQDFKKLMRLYMVEILTH